MTIKIYEINDEVIIADSVNPVIGKQTISNNMRILEQPCITDQLITSNLKQEPCDDNVYFSNAEKQSDNLNNQMCNRLKLLRNKI